MNSYFRILKFVVPYKKHLAITFVCTFLFAIFSGISVYLTIPLLDTLFQESEGKEIQQEETSAVDDPSSLLPDWAVEFKDSVENSFREMILSGDQSEILTKICFLIILAFLLKNIFF